MTFLCWFDVRLNIFEKQEIKCVVAQYLLFIQLSKNVPSSRISEQWLHVMSISAACFH